MEDTNSKSIFTAATSTSTSTTESYNAENCQGATPPGLQHMFSPLAPSFRPRDDIKGFMAHQEPRPGDIAPPTPQVDDEMLTNFRNSGSDFLFNDADHNSFFMGGTPRTESVSSNIWGDASGTTTPSVRQDDSYSFEFLAKSLASANQYVSMLTREQLSVLRSFSPRLLYEFLHEVARVRSEKRMRRASPNECAFCKNNGENEESYTSHALKDWRGRVVCPVLRDFRCPRCGQTGDRAHTIKYCPEQADNGLDRSGSFVRRRMAPNSSLMFSTLQQPLPQHPAPTPSPAPNTPSFGHSSIWNNFQMN